MPKEVHDKLEKQADKLGLTGERRRAYIFGTLLRLKKEGSKKIKSNPKRAKRKRKRRK